MPLTDAEVREALSGIPVSWFLDPEDGCIFAVTDPGVILQWQQDPTRPRPARITLVVVEDDEFALALAEFLKREGRVCSRAAALSRFGLG